MASRLSDVNTPTDVFQVLTDLRSGGGSNPQRCDGIAMWCRFPARVRMGPLSKPDRVVIAWIDRHRIARVVYGTNGDAGRVKSSIPIWVPVLLGASESAKSIPPEFQPCTRAALYDVNSWLASGELKPGALLPMARPARIAIEDRMVTGPRAPLWLYWELDSRGLVIAKGVHGSP
jgi:hypothetical protein